MNRSARNLEYHSQSQNTLEPVAINNTNIEVVPSAKLLGVMISNDLKWNVHVEMICKKVAVRLYFLRQLKRTKLPANDLLSFYTTCIRPIFHTALPQYLSDQLEHLQKRALRIISTNDSSHRQALEVFNSFFRALQTSSVLHNSIVLAKE